MSQISGQSSRIRGAPRRVVTLFVGMFLTLVPLASAEVHLLHAVASRAAGPTEETRDVRALALLDARQALIEQVAVSLNPDLQSAGVTDEEAAGFASCFVDLDAVNATVKVKVSRATLRLEAACEIDLDMAARTAQNIVKFPPAREALGNLEARSLALRNRLIRMSEALLHTDAGVERDQLVLQRREALRLAEALPLLAQAWAALCEEPPQQFPLPGERESDPLKSRVWRPLFIPRPAAAKCLERALQFARRAEGLNDRSPDAKTHLGLLLFQADRKEAAIEALRKATVLDPESAFAHDGLGKALMEKEDAEGAIHAWETAARLDPRNAEIQVELANARRRTGDLNGIVHAWRTVIDIEPENAPAHASLGSALMAQGDLDEATDAYRQAIALQPENASFHYGLGEVLYGRGDLDGAIAAYRTAVARDSNHVQAHHNLGVALRAKGDLKGAIAAYRQVIRLQPNTYEAYYNLGNALVTQGDLLEAVQAYQKAAQLNPGDASSYNNIGSALRVNRDLEGAIRAYRMAVQIDPTSSAQYNLGLVLRQKGDRAGAISAFRAYLQWCTDARQKQQIEGAIRELGGSP